MNGRLLASIVSVSAIAGCGMDMSLPPLSPLPVVQLATKAELAAEDVVPGSYIVAFRGQSIAHRLLTLPSYSEEWAFHNQYLLSAFTYDPRVEDIRYIHAIDGARRFQAEPGPLRFLMTPWKQEIVDEDAPADPIVLSEVTFASPEEAATVLAEWEEQGDIWFADPNFLTRLSQDEDPPATSNGVFQQYKTEYSVSTPWWLTNINLLAAFDVADTYTDDPQTPVIAVLDSGLDTEHTGFTGRIFENSSPGVAGCRGDVNGCNTTDPAKGELGTGDVSPFGYTGSACPEVDKKNCQHGTHVAGIVAANYNGNYGGVCPVCKVMPIRVISGSPGKGAAKDSAIVNGMVYLSRFTTKSTASALVRVANSSFGKYSRSRAVSLMVSILAKNNGLLVVGAASNEDSMLRAYPAALNDAIAVGAVDIEDRKASYSNFGAWVDVSAPGGDSVQTGGFSNDLYVSTVPGGEAEGKQGTSMAAPVVAGVAGLILSVDPKRSLKALRSSIIDTADPRIYANEGATVFNQSYYVNIGVEVRRPLLGSGVVDAAAAIENSDKSGVRVSGISRVNNGCAVIAAADAAWPLQGLALLLLPLIFGLHRLLKWGKA